MWSDNETSEDLLGFRVHSDLLRDVVTDSAMLPAVIGVFGDWGGGKSSIMSMLKEDLEKEEYKDVVCLYFNGWMFEGYEDAKTALLTSVLLQLGEHKTFGPKVQDGIVGLLKRVQWMEVGKLAVKHVGVPLAVAAMTGGAGAIPAFLMSLIPGGKVESAAKGDAEEGAEGSGVNWLDQIVAAQTKPDLLEVRKFRDEFAGLLKQTTIRSLVILIDDLDRCLPDRIIETLEAIKLFVAVPNTAFVIGADPRIVRHAIATRYARQAIGEQAGVAEEYDLVQDYLEKLIQIPYHLPRLSPPEIETYINLLLCQKHLSLEQHGRVMAQVGLRRQEKCFAPFTYGDIRDVLEESELVDGLALQLAWSSAVALAITEGLKGNPRQVKRMLNAMMLRTKLAAIAKLEIRSDVLAKLMVLEYTLPARFRELDAWQTVAKGYPDQLRALEEEARSTEGAATTEDGVAEWRKLQVRNWLAMDPALSDVDLQDYFWVARDRTKSTLASASAASPLVKRLYSQLIGESDGERAVAVKDAGELDATEIESLCLLLEQHAIRHPDQTGAFDALRALADANVVGAASTLISAVGKALPASMAPSIPTNLALFAVNCPERVGEITMALEGLSKKADTLAGKAAAIALKNIERNRATEPGRMSGRGR